MHETRNLEFKENISNSFLKTVSAFSNYDGGEILFGVDDNGNIKGLSDVTQARLDIENKVNDNITPQPDYTLELQNNDKIIKMTVKSGQHKPYMYKSKAYKRNDTATIEVDTLELSRLILQGRNIRFEELPYDEQNLTFETLSKKLKEKINLDVLTIDTLKTLYLYSDASGYNNAAGLLADNNHFLEMDIAKFGENISIIYKRVTLDNISVLSVYDRVLEVFDDYYQYEIIEGAVRKTVCKIPKEAFRETIANALIHRTWDIDVHIKVSMFDDRIEVVSPGGLPKGITETDFLKGDISALRNRNLANVFYRLGFVEVFGTGIMRIKQCYEHSLVQPDFIISENTIKIILPVFEDKLKLTNDQIAVYNVLSKNSLKSISEICGNLPFGKSKVTKLLQEMNKNGVVLIEGNGKATRYRLR